MIRAQCDKPAPQNRFFSLDNLLIFWREVTPGCAILTQLTAADFIFHRFGDYDLVRPGRPLPGAKKVFRGCPKGEPRSSCNHLQRLRIVLRRVARVCGFCYVERVRRRHKEPPTRSQ